ncbi:TetR/AcrR family transcriptional regulator [Gordonia sp. NPDC003376]
MKALHDASISLVREGDLTSVTIDAITERAGVSRRTFFNYYATKEDAILGTTAPVIPDAALAEFFDDTSGTDQFTRTLRLISAIIQTTREIDRTELGEFRELLAGFPELRSRLQQHTTAAENLVEGVLTEHFSKRGNNSGEAADAARALLLLASAVMRFAYSRDPGVIAEPEGEAVAGAIEVFRHALDSASLRA